MFSSITPIILGPTGAGKTGVAIEIAKEIERRGRAGVAGSSVMVGPLGAEIISADSGAVYKGMDLGTAKPSVAERQGVPHWGIDLVEPGERFTVVEWKEHALSRIAEIRERGKLPLIVGGTGLYVDALAFDYQFTQEAKNNCADRQKPCINYLLIGVKTEPEILRSRLMERVNKIFVQELFVEARRIMKKYDKLEGVEGEKWRARALKNNIYQYAWRYMRGELSLEEAKRQAFYADWHLAKRQMTWFKRNEQIKWLPLDKIRDFVIKWVYEQS